MICYALSPHEKASHRLHEHVIAEWLREEFGAFTKRGRKIASAVTGYEQERNASLMENIRDFIDALALKVDVKNRDIEIRASSEAHSARKCASRPYDLPTHPP